MSPPLFGSVFCKECGENHRVVRSHLGRWDQGWLYKAICDGLSDFHRGEHVAF